MPNRPRQHGFTIVELLVTMTILGLMLFLVNQLFNDTSRAVTTSVQVSKTVAASRSINEQLTIDAAAMIGPDSDLNNEGGYIVIIQERLPDVAMLNPQTLGEVPNPVDLRIDQILFIRDAEGLKSMTPSGPNSYGTDIVGEAGDRAKVWYGHGQRVLANGQRRTLTLANAQLGGANAQLDRVGSDFILCRQAMLFNPSSLDTTNDTYTDTALNFSTVRNPGTGAPVPPRSYCGLTDVTVQDYRDLLTVLTDGTNDDNQYRNTAYYALNDRLSVNPSPSVDDTDYASWAIAQGHPILAPNCSEMIIDFAADLDGDGQIDTAFGGQGGANAPVWWYDGIEQPFMGSAANNGTWEAQAGLVQPQIVDNANFQQFIFRVNDDVSFDDAGGTVGSAGTAHSYWPYLIRIRYRLHDTRGRLTSNYADALRDGLDNDGDGNPDVNGGGTDVDEDRISGRWFERIIRVPRP